MAKTNAPTVQEVLRGESAKAQALLRSLAKKHNAGKGRLEKAHLALYNKTGFKSNNTLILGFKSGKFIFMPLIDKE